MGEGEVRGWAGANGVPGRAGHARAALMPCKLGGAAQPWAPAAAHTSAFPGMLRACVRHATAGVLHARPGGACAPSLHARTFWRPSSEVSTKNSTGSPSRRERKPSEMMAVWIGMDGWMGGDQQEGLERRGRGVRGGARKALGGTTAEDAAGAQCIAPGAQTGPRRPSRG